MLLTKLKIATVVVTMLSALLLSAAVTAVVRPDTSTPLKETVEALNQKTPKGYFEKSRLRTPRLA